MAEESAYPGREGGAQHPNQAFVMRLIWDEETQKHRVQLRPTNGSKPLVFDDLEATFLYVAQTFNDHLDQDADLEPPTAPG